MIKKFEEYINEDYFSKLANRKDTGDVRKENKTAGNIKEMKPIPLNGELAIADRNLEVDGETFFSFDDVAEMNLGEWRLPTGDELAEHFFMIGDGDDDSNLDIDDEGMTFSDEDGSYEIYLHAYGIKSILVDKDGEHIQQPTVDLKNGAYIVEDNNLLSFNKTFGWSISQIPTGFKKHIILKYSVRLVKDL